MISKNKICKFSLASWLACFLHGLILFGKTRFLSLTSRSTLALLSYYVKLSQPHCRHPSRHDNKILTLGGRQQVGRSQAWMWYRQK